MTQRRPVILFAATVWWPLSARLAVRFIEYGCRVTAICPRGHLLRHVAGLDGIFTYSGMRSMASLEAAIRRTAPDVIIPCDDRVVWQLHELSELRPDLRPLIEASLGASRQFELIRCRHQLLETARNLDVRVPITKRIDSEEDIRSWFAGGEHSAVLKLDGTWGGEGVVIAHSEVEALEAFRRLSRPAGFGTACKRMLVNRDPLALWSWSRQSKPAISLQQFIEGRPANAMLACWNGELLSAVSVEVLVSLGPTGAAIVVRQTENQEMSRAARLLAGTLQLTGFCGLDFVLDSAGRSYLIEMNPRCTQLGHLPFFEGRDLAGALCEKLSGSPCTSYETPIHDQAVAFFARSLEWVEQHPLRRVYRDIPRGQPALVKELIRTSWPERQWIARVYHWFRPQGKTETTEFVPQDQSAAEVASSSSPEVTTDNLPAHCLYSGQIAGT